MEIIDDFLLFSLFSNDFRVMSTLTWLHRRIWKARWAQKGRYWCKSGTLGKTILGFDFNWNLFILVNEPTAIITIEKIVAMLKILQVITSNICKKRNMHSVWKWPKMSHTKNSICLKITQNVAFEFSNLGIFHQFFFSLKLKM